LIRRSTCTLPPRAGIVRPIRRPGDNNWDIAIAKRIPLGNEARFLQFRSEMFNVWNHTRYSGVDSGTSFDGTGPTAKITNANFGYLNAARSPRIMAFSLKLYF
jgi:hypothetical protein